MFARRWRLRRRASQRGRGVGKGGFSGCVGPWWEWRVSWSVLTSNGLAPLLALLTSGLEAGVLATHSQELEGFEALARDHCHLLHFAEEADFVGREPGWKGEGHVGVYAMALLVGVLVVVCDPSIIIGYTTAEWRSRVGRACPAIKLRLMD